MARNIRFGPCSKARSLADTDAAQIAIKNDQSACPADWNRILICHLPCPVKSDWPYTIVLLFRNITMRSSSNPLSRILGIIDEPQQFTRFVFFVLSIALFVRFAVLALNWPNWIWNGGTPSDQWDALAINLIDHGVFGFSPDVSTVIRGPIFPLVEIPLYLIFGRNYAGWSVSLLLLDTFTCFLLIVTTRRLAGNRTALLAGLYYAVNLPIIFYTAKISQVTSMLPLVVIWLYLFSLWEESYTSAWVPWVLGLVSGLTILNKTVFLPVPFICTAVLLWLRRAEIRRIRQLVPAMIYLIVTIGVVAPWTFRNYVVTNGKFIPVQGYFWELFVQDVLYYDLDAMDHDARSDGELLDYFKSREKEILIAHGASPDRPTNLTGPQWEIMCENAFRDACLKWIKEDPVKILKIKVANIWHFWLRAENWSKTRTLVLMQVVYLGAATTGLFFLWRFRQLYRVKYALVLVLVLWAEHCPVFAWGRFSLDLVPALGLVFGLGVDAWVKQANLKPLTSKG